MTKTVRAAKSERGWELEFLCNGVWAFNQEELSEVFPSQRAAEEAVELHLAIVREWSRPDEFDLACERRFDE